MGRTDVVRCDGCPVCNGSGKSHRNRKKACTECDGTGRALVCKTCGGLMPCLGTDPDVFDQSVCILRSTTTHFLDTQ
jgi:RecJ-like exonuclease